MTRERSTPRRHRKASAIYRRAAERAFIHGDGIAILEAHPRLEKEFWSHMDAIPLGSGLMDDAERCLGMLLLAEIAKDKETA